jgi:hypothetical protein
MPDTTLHTWPLEAAFSSSLELYCCGTATSLPGSQPGRLGSRSEILLIGLDHLAPRRYFALSLGFSRFYFYIYLRRNASEWDNVRLLTYL